MEILLAAAYFLPILFLAAFIGYEGKRYVFYLLWGFGASVLVMLLYPAVTGALGTVPAPALGITPLLEELFKALPIIVPALLGARNSDKDLLVCAMASGIGFSIVETWMVIDPAAIAPTLPGVLGLLARTFSTSLMHGCTCGIIGYGIVLARGCDRATLLALIFGFYTVAVTTHGMYNLLLTEFFGPAGIILDLVIPVLLFFVLLTCYHVDIPALFAKKPAA